MFKGVCGWRELVEEEADSWWFYIQLSVRKIGEEFTQYFIKLCNEFQKGHSYKI